MKSQFYFFLIFLFTINFCSKTYSQNALDFDGIDDFILTNFQGVQGTNPRTVEAWIKTTANSIPTDGGHQQIIVDWGMFVTGGRFTFNVLWGSAIRLEVGGNGVNGTIPVNDGIWHHVAATFDPNQSDQIRLYVDGQLDTFGTTTVALNTQPNVNLQIGQRIDGINNFEGQIDEVRIWDIALTQAEIQTHIGKEICAPTNNLVAYYSFNEGVANGNNLNESTLLDRSGNSFDGILNNFALDGEFSNWVDGAMITPGVVVSNESLEICGNSFTWPANGITYDASGTYSALLNSDVGCDTSASLNLTLIELDTTVSLNGMTLSSNAMGVNYQWVDCDNNFSNIPNETAFTFEPTESGNYAVEIQQGNCISLSSCFDIEILNINSLDLKPEINFYPNPISNILVIEKENLDKYEIEVFDLNGRLVKSGNFNSKTSTLNLEDIKIGFYFLKISDEKDQNFVFEKIIKQ